MMVCPGSTVPPMKRLVPLSRTLTPAFLSFLLSILPLLLLLPTDVDAVTTPASLDDLEPMTTSIPEMMQCNIHQTCHECQADVACGWCDDDTGTGIGICMEGDQLGPINADTGVTQNSKCPTPRWYFTECPLCNCNGHSRCENGSQCITPCANNTVGPQCEHCIEKFFGKPINGGLCEPCDCSEHGDTCNRETGHCNCHIKGVTGDRCDRCDTYNGYVGEPLHGSCFYDLHIDYNFTFTLSEEKDPHIHQINFLNAPTKSDVDTDFDILCSKETKIDISAKTTKSHESWIIRNFTGTQIKRRFSASEYTFGSADDSTTFHVYVYNFTPPIEIIVSFSQHPKFNVLEFVTSTLTSLNSFWSWG